MHDDVLRLRRLVDDLAVIAAGAADALRPFAEANQQQVHRQLETAVIHGDPTRLAQIIMNLLSNAIKFTPVAGTVELVDSTVGTTITVTFPMSPLPVP